MKKEMSSVVSQVPVVGEEPAKPFPIPSAPGISGFDDVKWVHVSGVEVLTALECVFDVIL